MPAAEPHRTDPEQLATHRTQVEPQRRTFPLTPSTVGASPVHPQVPTQEITSARARALPRESDVPKVRSVSASDSDVDALEAYRVPRENEYDKLVGQTLDGRYYVEKKIGEGGMGVVFSARHAVIERPLAIKVLKREVMRDTATIRRFVQEAKAASRIGHPNIVDVTDFGTTPDGMTYSVMEFVDGQTLGTAIRNSAPSPLRAIKIAAQIARALGAAHDKGITHRDLKPENVFLLDRDGRTDFVKIVDFGIAKVAPVPGSAAEPRLTRAGSVFGTPEYMAPEQAAGRGDTDGRVDIYALGVILYEMTCGRVPHRGDSMVRTLAMQMLDPAEPPTKVRPDLGIPPELEAVIMMALAKKREQRYQTMGELLAALEKVHTIVGQSITGSPVYALAPLPPGADASLASPGPASPTSQPPTSRPAGPMVSRAHTPTGRRLKNEPEFTASDRPHTFEHVLDDTDAPRGRKAWPPIVLLLLIAGGATTVVVLMMKNRSATTATADAGIAIVTPPTADAGVTPATPDATVVAMIPIDAAEVIPAADAALAPADAADDIVVVRTDAGVRIRRDAGAGSGSSTDPGYAEPPRHDHDPGADQARGREPLRWHDVSRPRRHDARGAPREPPRPSLPPARVQGWQGPARVLRQDRGRAVRAGADQDLHQQHQEPVRRLRARSDQAVGTGSVAHDDEGPVGGRGLEAQEVEMFSAGRWRTGRRRGTDPRSRES
ncbi:MAG: serine/threonine protein kinase [Myxococcales bacterium]|nr:serine/threonine protein kinase [Myxococcales bacterium]